MRDHDQINEQFFNCRGKSNGEKASARSKQESGSFTVGKRFHYRLTHPLWMFTVSLACC